MTRYELTDEDGNALYKGRTVEGEAGWRDLTVSQGLRTPVGRGLAAVLVAVVAVAVTLGLHLWWPVAVLTAALFGQITLNRLKPSPTVHPWDRPWGEGKDLTALIPAQESAEARAHREKVAMVRLSADAELPYIDFDTGMIWTPQEARDWLVAEDHKDGLRKRIKELAAQNTRLGQERATAGYYHRVGTEKLVRRNRQEIAALTAELREDQPHETSQHEEPQGQAAALEAIEDVHRDLDEAEAGSWGNIRAVEGGPKRRIVTADGEVHDLTPGDMRVIIRTLAGPDFGPDARITLMSGVELTGADMAAIVWELAETEGRKAWRPELEQPVARTGLIVTGSWHDLVTPERPDPLARYVQVVNGFNGFGEIYTARVAAPNETAGRAFTDMGRVTDASTGVPYELRRMADDGTLWVVPLRDGGRAL